MVNIFGFKLFESPSIEEKPYHRTRRRHHFKNKHRSKRRHYYKGGYIYDNVNLAGQDVTAELSSVMSTSSKSSVNKGKKNSSSKGRGRGTKTRSHSKSRVHH